VKKALAQAQVCAQKQSKSTEQINRANQQSKSTEQINRANQQSKSTEQT